MFGFCDLVWVSQPAKRNIVLHLFLHLCERFALLQAFHYRSVDVTGAEHIHSDTTAPQIICPGPSKRTNGGLRSAVHTHGGKAFDIGNRSSQDDRPAIPFFREAVLHREEESFHVCVEVNIKKSLIHSAERG